MAGYRHVLAPVDVNDPQTSAMERAAQLAHEYGARLTLLHVVEHFPEDLPVEFIAPENVDPKAALLERTGSLLGELCRTTGCERAEVQVVTSTHSARSEILDFAQRNGVDLIVLGAHREARRLPSLGSTSGSLVGHAACDVLVVKAHLAD